jgi:hypothetical protein
MRIPYLGVGGEELAVRFRIAFEEDRFQWKSGSKPCLYGLHRRAEAQKARHRGRARRQRRSSQSRPSDGHPALRDAVGKWLSRSTTAPAKLVSLPMKDPSALHLERPEQFARRRRVACLDAIPWSAVEANAVERSAEPVESPIWQKLRFGKTMCLAAPRAFL